jgi:hypothetical protein
MELDFTGVAVTDEEHGIHERNILALRDAVDGDLFPLSHREELSEFIKKRAG